MRVPILIGRRGRGRAKIKKQWEVVRLAGGGEAMGDGLRAEIRARRQELLSKGGGGYEELRYYEVAEKVYRFDPQAKGTAEKIRKENEVRSAEAEAAARAAERDAAQRNLAEAEARAASAGIVTAGDEEESDAEAEWAAADDAEADEADEAEADEAEADEAEADEAEADEAEADEDEE